MRREWIADLNPDALFADGYDAALIGIAERCGQPTLAVYSVPAMINVLVERDGMSEEEAAEFISFNTLGCWAGENTPLFFWPLKDDDAPG